MIWFIQRLDINVGDWYCNPFRYFRFSDFGAALEVMGNSPPPRDPAIFGSVLHDGFYPSIQRHLEGRRLSILWGAGVNTHEAKEATLPPFMGKFTLVGLRDWDVGYRWVPCPSCMDPAFDIPRQRPTRSVVVFDHMDIPVRVGSLPRMSNRVGDLRKVLDFLASGETILTTSYHGAYWATLLGRKVVVYGWSNKFFHMKHPPAILEEEDWPSLWRDAAKRAAVYPNALEECRDSNRRFWFDVERTLKA